MIDQTNAPSVPSVISEWQAESWRLSAFLPPSAQVPEQNWWADLVGEPPELEQSNRRQGTYQAHGRYERGRLVLVIQPSRVDWHYTAAPAPEEEPPDEIPSLGLPSEAFEALRRPILRWLEVSPPINRLAIGGVLNNLVESRQEAYRLIADYVPGLRLNTEGCSDLLYQINRPRNSAVHTGLLINRLSKWSAGIVSVMQFSPSDPTNISQRELYTVARVELDINTAAGFPSVLSASELSSLVAELVDLGLEIAERGDVP